MGAFFGRVIAYVVLVAANAGFAYWVLNDVPVLMDLSFGQLFSVISVAWATYVAIDIYRMIADELR